MFWFQYSEGTSLKHNGPLFNTLEYIPINVKLLYEGKEIELTPKSEEVAGLYAKMLAANNPNATKSIFKKNFFSDWRKIMTDTERITIEKLQNCNFEKMILYFKNKIETEEEKKSIEEQKKTHGHCTIDDSKERLGSFQIVSPTLFKGENNNPNNGKLKRRICPEDVIINCSKDSVPKPPDGYTWKEKREDRTVEWLASWTDELLKTRKYMRLHETSEAKGKSDCRKYETARALHKIIGKIRDEYKKDYESTDYETTTGMKRKQRGVALYFIDELALRVGNEIYKKKSDTVGCCSLRVRDITLGKPNIVNLHFSGKDSINFNKTFKVDELIFNNLELFIGVKEPNEKLFNMLEPDPLNKYLNGQQKGLTAKVFRTYNASLLLEKELGLTKPGKSLRCKILEYKQANRKVAQLCNHKKTNPKTKKDEDKIDALDSSKLNYLDPRITIAWCIKNQVPVEKIYNKSERDKFAWAMKSMNTRENFVFAGK